MKNLTTVLDWVRFAVTELSHPQTESELIFGHGSLNPFDEAHALVLGSLNLPFNLGVEYYGAKLTDDEISLVKAGLRARIEEKKPVPYITQRSFYMGLEFYVDERVLIPRSPIMELIEANFAPYCEPAPQNILDLCCGSGCLGIASAYFLPNSHITLADIDTDALDVSAINVNKHDMTEQVSIVHSDLFSDLSGKTFDLIVSNPPYVDSQTMACLPDEFLHEPEFALASGEDGLDITRKILREAVQYLDNNGILIIEVGASWDLLEKAYPDIPFRWHNFERGGEGVLIMTYDELNSFQPFLESAN